MTAWIEIGGGYAGNNQNNVAVFMTAWIEINYVHPTPCSPPPA
jgi:hypothetical protein